MIKVALVSKDEKQVREAVGYLAANYEITNREDSTRDEQFVTVVNLSDSMVEEIEKTLSLIKNATGIDPAENEGRKSRCVVRSRSAASYILRHRFNLSYQKIGKILKCNHATVIMRIRKMNHAEVGKTVPIELAIARVLRAI